MRSASAAAKASYIAHYIDRVRAHGHDVAAAGCLMYRDMGHLLSHKRGALGASFPV